MRVFNAKGKILKALQRADQPSSVVDITIQKLNMFKEYFLYTGLTILLCLSCFCLFQDRIHAPYKIHCYGVCSRFAKYSLSNTFANCALVVSVLVYLWNEALLLGLWSTCSSFPGTAKNVYLHFNFFFSICLQHL